jgi:hypothetical protein
MLQMGCQIAKETIIMYLLISFEKKKLTQEFSKKLLAHKYLTKPSPCARTAKGVKFDPAKVSLLV